MPQFQAVSASVEPDCPALLTLLSSLISVCECFWCAWLSSCAHSAAILQFQVVSASAVAWLSSIAQSAAIFQFQAVSASAVLDCHTFIIVPLFAC
jgi:hypothetical protein